MNVMRLAKSLGERLLRGPTVAQTSVVTILATYIWFMGSISLDFDSARSFVPPSPAIGWGPAYALSAPIRADASDLAQKSSIQARFGNDQWSLGWAEQAIVNSIPEGGPRAIVFERSESGAQALKDAGELRVVTTIPSRQWRAIPGGVEVSSELSNRALSIQMGTMSLDTGDISFSASNFLCHGPGRVCVVAIISSAKPLISTLTQRVFSFDALALLWLVAGGWILWIRKGRLWARALLAMASPRRARSLGLVLSAGRAPKGNSL